MLFKKILFIVFLIGVNHAFAQARKDTKPAFKGSVINERGEVIPFANVSAFNATDSSLVGGSATDIDGFFSIALPPATYFLTFSFLSYESKSIYNLTLDNKSIDLGKIKLAIKSELLEEVEISAERSQMELKLDKRVFNIEKDLANTGANAAEILDNIPSVQVDVEGNVSLRGSENVRVLIDGKPSALTGSSTADVLRQFQGSMIEKVEVITNPSARYDAEGEVGIINIVLKKEKKKGINGGFETVVGYPDNYRASFNLNYRTEHLNLFTSYGLSYRDSPGEGSTDQTFQNADTSFVYESDSERQRKSLGNNLRIGTDIFLNALNTITVSGIYNYSDQENIAEIDYRDLFEDGRLFQRVVRKDVEDETGKNLESNISYIKKFKEEDRKFTIDLRWSESDDLEKSNIRQTNFLTNDLLLQRSSNKEANRTILIQSDYIHPLSGKRLLEGGLRSTLRTIENVFQVLESLNGADFVVLDQFNNNFRYDENIHAAYLQFGNEIDQFSYQIGLRGEYSDIQSDLKLTNANFKQEYFNLFPSLFLTYKFSKTKNLQLSYSRRINRPSYRFLLPFQTFSDNRNLWRGNPRLQPEYTDSYELGYLRYFEKGSIFTSLYYRYREGVIERITSTNAEGISERFPINLSVENNVGLELNSSYKFNKRFSTTTNFNFYRQVREGNFEGQRLENDVFTWSNRSTLKVEIIPKVDLQASFRYNAPQKTTQGRTKSLSHLDLSAGKDILAGKGTLVASVRDVFNSRKRRWETETEFLRSESEFQWRARQFLLTFSYRINEQKKRGGGRSSSRGNGANI